MPTVSRRTKRVIIALAAIAILALLWFNFVGVFVEYLWFGEVEHRQVFATQILSRLVMFLIATVVVGGLVFGSFLLAYRSRPVFVPTADADPLAPYRTVDLDPAEAVHHRPLRLIGCDLRALAQAQWATVQLFLHGGLRHRRTPQFGHDVGFYVFNLPMYQLVLNWLFLADRDRVRRVLVTQYVFGGIRLAGPRPADHRGRRAPAVAAGGHVRAAEGGRSTGSTGTTLLFEYRSPDVHRRRLHRHQRGASGEADPDVHRGDLRGGFFVGAFVMLDLGSRRSRWRCWCCPAC